MINAITQKDTNAYFYIPVKRPPMKPKPWSKSFVLSNEKPVQEFSPELPSSSIRIEKIIL
jgi:hypothetical protein